MERVETSKYSIAFDREDYTLLRKYMATHSPSKVVVLTDTHTHESCLPVFVQKANLSVPIEVLTIAAGEENKTLATCTFVWEELSRLQADRKTLLLNLGGGVVCDLGGFVAATYMRGIPFFHFPTSLLAMVDASVGGKTGVDLNHLKNQVGAFAFPQGVVIDSDFLKTLPQDHLHSGLAEMWKHGLIASEAYWRKMCGLPLNIDDALEKAIQTSVHIKNKIVTDDPFEQSHRKVLNFGHTLGHAIESYFLSNNDKTMLHGEAVAIGMVLEGYLSTLQYGFPKEELLRLYGLYSSYFTPHHFEAHEVKQILELIVHDKKNTRGNVHFVLLQHVAKPVIDCKVEASQLKEAFTFFNSLVL